MNSMLKKLVAVMIGLGLLFTGCGDASAKGTDVYDKCYDTKKLKADARRAALSALNMGEEEFENLVKESFDFRLTLKRAEDALALKCVLQTSIVEFQDVYLTRFQAGLEDMNGNKQQSKKLLKKVDKVYTEKSNALAASAKKYEEYWLKWGAYEFGLVPGFVEVLDSDNEKYRGQRGGYDIVCEFAMDAMLKAKMELLAGEKRSTIYALSDEPDTLPPVGAMCLDFFMGITKDTTEPAARALGIMFNDFEAGDLIEITGKESLNSEMFYREVEEY